MTAFYEPRDERILAERQAKAGALNSIEFFMCSDGNYRDAESKKLFEEMREKQRNLVPLDNGRTLTPNQAGS